MGGMTVIYIDVSHHDRNRRGAPLNWSQIAGATSKAMCARVSYGDPSGFNPSSPYASEHLANAKTAGFTLRGGYHNLIRGDQASINRQVDLLRSKLDSYDCNWAMCDVEPYAELVTNGLWPRWDDVRQFHDRFYAVDGRVLVWYIPRWFWNNRSNGIDLNRPNLTVLKGPLVQSNYAGGDGTPKQVYANAGGDAGPGWDDVYGGRRPDIWQYTAGGNCPGASNNTDCNAFRGTFAQLSNLLAGGGLNAPGGDVATFEDVWRVDKMEPPGGHKTDANPTWWPENVLRGAYEQAEQSRLAAQDVNEHVRLRVLGKEWSVAGRTLAGSVEALIAKADQIITALGQLDFPSDLTQRLDAILAAAQDDGDVTVQLPPEAFDLLTEIRDRVNMLPARP
jgi:GH25 family lysozyme M1 (1,4-beta-N-acetylmuramidase)